MMRYPEFGSPGSFVRVQVLRNPSDIAPASDGQAEATLLRGLRGVSSLDRDFSIAPAALGSGLLVYRRRC
jgi:hypothetical protein